jgi:hypothetical protein
MSTICWLLVLTRVQIWRKFVLQRKQSETNILCIRYLVAWSILCASTTPCGQRGHFSLPRLFSVNYWLYIKVELKCMSYYCLPRKMDFNGCLVLVAWLSSWIIFLLILYNPSSFWCSKNESMQLLPLCSLLGEFVSGLLKWNVFLIL